MNDNHIGTILKKNFNNVNNVNKYNDNNVNNDHSKYALNREKFKPNTEESMLAEELALYFDDLKNFAFYFRVVKNRGIYGAREFLASIKDEINAKKDTKYEIRDPKKYFTWKYKKGLI